MHVRRRRRPLKLQMPIRLIQQPRAPLPLEIINHVRQGVPLQQHFFAISETEKTSARFLRSSPSQSHNSPRSSPPKNPPSRTPSPSTDLLRPPSPPSLTAPSSRSRSPPLKTPSRLPLRVPTPPPASAPPGHTPPDSTFNTFMSCAKPAPAHRTHHQRHDNRSNHLHTDPNLSSRNAERIINPPSLPTTYDLRQLRSKTPPNPNTFHPKSSFVSFVFFVAIYPYFPASSPKSVSIRVHPWLISVPAQHT